MTQSNEKLRTLEKMVISIVGWSLIALSAHYISNLPASLKNNPVYGAPTASYSHHERMDSP